MTNWQKRYEQLAALYSAMDEKNRELESLCNKISYHIEESVRLDLSDRGKSRFMRLKVDVSIKAEYDYNVSRNIFYPPKLYPAGTLIECGPNGIVYLDDEGDGYLNFPPESLEPIEVDSFDPSIDWNKVVYQG